MEFYTKVCLEVRGKLDDLRKLEDLHRACVDAHQDVTTEPSELVRAVFPEWQSEEDSINPESVTIKIAEAIQPYAIIGDDDGYANVYYVARLLQGWLKMIDGNNVIAFEYSHEANRSVPGCYMPVR